MPIIFDKDRQIFKLDTKDSTYIIKIYDEGYLLNLYYGKKIPDCNLDCFETRMPNASFSPVNAVIGEGRFSPDTAPLEYSGNGAGDFRISAISVRNKYGNSITDLRYVSYEIINGKPLVKGLPLTYISEEKDASTLIITTTDKTTNLIVKLYYTVFENYSVMTKRVEAVNNSDEELIIERLYSSCNDFPSMDYDMITLWGRHCFERSIERRPLSHGVQGVESKRGASGHCQNPFVALVSHNANEEYGDAYGFNFVYSGNFSALAECDFNFSTRLIVGINPTDFEWHLGKNETFESPEVVCVYSANGIGEMSRTFHHFYNSHLIRGRYKTEKRPLLINSWEAAYFDISVDKLVDFAVSAKELGIEMLVMDDGWFGNRNDDTSSLGDWFANKEKFPSGLEELEDKVHSLGLKFGIWFEPEMISENSKLFREHPDWYVHAENRRALLGRHQYVIDMTRQDVRDNIWNQLNDVLKNNKIDYIKWDFNRNIADATSVSLPTDRKKEFFHRFIIGTYELMDKLTKTYPNILFENCSGGGGRFDPAMLCYSPQIWASDNTNAMDRIGIQYGTSLCYPASAMGAHVSANAGSSYDTKGDVALWGTFGFELDPRKLTDDEKATFKKKIAEYHKYYDLIHNGDLYRLLSPFENGNKVAWEFVSADKKEMLLTIVCKKGYFAENFILKFKGLDENKYYLNTDDGKVYSGALLMNAGLNLTGAICSDNSSRKWYFVEKT